MGGVTVHSMVESVPVEKLDAAGVISTVNNFTKQFKILWPEWLKKVLPDGRRVCKCGCVVGRSNWSSHVRIRHKTPRQLDMSLPTNRPDLVTNVIRRNGERYGKNESRKAYVCRCGAVVMANEWSRHVNRVG